ncbi:mandelate racemase/muconate lactonizing enzyme family protein [Actinoalloteichus hymeniacidonis]|uniref:Enolase superfamily enzyme related to L-alanine-DL-glutamate epimerase n=1 Tax=Actinoalloteichus hymeniacidonis TaxID=340345 RepID=A0AAC9MZW3_9PSEU|nr:mandelate racemase/muconate lactonizing enzyme family protein [Actinoalloteichus hymeniacidonis]AOS64919.1 enolase superfamily enzyme related to L-alanine-DL-glutamate epimerase [Actinoalloteichus hymeniacidonis]MBB5907006.1 L-alanine-DL-glutamate epimerase-like enolase superfamily enzyme [Actinoalloteichus hymeniacidonis]
MRITELTSQAYTVPLERSWGPGVDQHHLIVTTIRTEDGQTGTGFSWTPLVGAHSVLAMLEHDLPRLVVGAELAPACVLWDRWWAGLHEGGSGGITTMAIAAVDIALWDLRAKAAGLPLVDFIGRRRESVGVYGSGVNLYYELDELLDQVRGFVAAGQRAVKIKVGSPELERDLERVAEVRGILGEHRLLMIDANQRWDHPTAVRAIRSLAAYDPYWIEEPLLADELPGLARLRAEVPVPVAVGENLRTVYQFRDALTAGAVDFVQPNAVRVGGITPFLRIAELAATFGVPTAPHLLPELSGQLAMCVGAVSMVEDIDNASFQALGALAQPSGVTVQAPVVHTATAPGHGLIFATERLTPLN